MADTGFVGDKPLTFDSDLDLGHGNLNFEHNKSPHLVYLSVKFDRIPFIGFSVMAD